MFKIYTGSQTPVEFKRYEESGTEVSVSSKFKFPQIRFIESILITDISKSFPSK